MKLYHVTLCSLSLLLFGACSDATPTEEVHPDVLNEVATDTHAEDLETSPQADDAETSRRDATPTPQRTFTHKMMKATDENPPFSSLAYECFECTAEQQASIVPPEGWTKGPVQLTLVTGELRSRPTFEGVEDAVDFLEDVPGEEYKLIAKNISGEIIEAGPNGFIAEVKVIRDTLLRFEAGGRVHEFTDPDGRVFVLFAHEVNPEDPDAIDFEAADALGEIYEPEGWTYSTRILEDALLLDTPEVATVLAIRGAVTSTWEMR